MNPQPFVIKPADRKTALNVLATQVTVLTAGGDSSDQRITLQAGAEGTGPPPHSHDWDESFYVRGGKFSSRVAAKVRCAPRARSSTFRPLLCTHSVTGRAAANRLK